MVLVKFLMVSFVTSPTTVLRSVLVEQLINSLGAITQPLYGSGYGSALRQSVLNKQQGEP